MGIFKTGQVEYDDEINIVHEIIKTILYIFTIAFLIFLVWNYVGCRSEVIGHSMESTLYDGESVWLDKITYQFREPARFDIVVFPYQDSEANFIKRIIGLPGETIYIDPEGRIYIGTEDTLYMEKDGSVHNEVEYLEEDYGKEVIQESRRGLAAEPLTLGADEYFVMGDNRNNSQDSRYEAVGPISRDRIEGRVAFRLWPLDVFGKIDRK
ncbi:MAG: signal peptidase I [Bacteroides sp.]|nr:signal peptidase I [Bacteroides sp.]MCM1550863.1 signal peptidase I [Clostridium sp.]